jgi:hypothetical protein
MLGVDISSELHQASEAELPFKSYTRSIDKRTPFIHNLPFLHSVPPLQHAN